MTSRRLPLILLVGLACLGRPAWCSDFLHVRQASEDWDGARARVSEDQEWRDWLHHETQRVQTWKAREQDRADLAAGWIHDFHDRDSGALRALPADAACTSGTAGDTARAACRALRRHQNIRMLLTAARLARLTGSREAAGWAAAQLDLYLAVLPRGQGPGQGVLFRQALDDANVLPILADAVRLLRPLAEAKRAERWCTEFLLPMAGRLMLRHRHVHNVALWYTAASAIAALECGDEDLLQQTLDGPRSLRSLLGEGIGPDGFWFELSLGYQNYVVHAMHEVLLAAALRGRSEALQAVHPQVLALLASPMRVQFEGGDGPTINDSNRHPRIPDTTLLQSVRRTLPTAQGIALARTTKDWDILLDPDTAGPTLAGSMPQGGARIDGLKSLSLRIGSWQALLRAGQGGRFHAHQDILSFELKHDTTWLFRHSATPAYGSALHREYYKLAPAHNTPLVDGLGSSNWFARPESVKAEPGSIAAAFRSFQRGVRVRRELEAGDRSITDRLHFEPAVGGRNADRARLGTAASAGHGPSYGAIYHTDCSLSGTPPSSPPAPLPVQAGFRHLEALASWSAERTWAAHLECDGQTFHLQVRASRPLTLTRLSSPALAPARKRTGLLLDTTGHGAAWIELELEASRADGMGPGR